jgi:hypothetical protein
MAYDVEVDTSRASFEECAERIRIVVTSTEPPTAMRKVRNALANARIFDEAT